MTQNDFQDAHGNKEQDKDHLGNRLLAPHRRALRKLEETGTSHKRNLEELDCKREPFHETMAKVLKWHVPASRDRNRRIK
jgi:hypothetical protein